MRNDVSAVMIKHIKELNHILHKYNIFDKTSLVSESEKDLIFQKAVLMSVGYIGELSKKLDDGIIKSNPNVNWRRLGKSRNIIFHDYDIVDMEIISSVIFKDIALLRLIKEVDVRDIKQAVDLINNVFSDFVAPDFSENGKNTFKNHLKSEYDEYFSDSRTGNKNMWACYQNGEILGIIATSDISHISHLFVDKKHHKKGIARHMFDFVLEKIKQHGGITQITVNSSPYAVKIYKKLGFIETDKQQEKDGIVYTPMIRNI